MLKERSKDRWLRNPNSLSTKTLRFFDKRKYCDARIILLVMIPNLLFILFNNFEPDEQHRFGVVFPKRLVFGNTFRQNFAVIICPGVDVDR